MPRRPRQLIQAIALGALVAAPVAAEPRLVADGGAVWVPDFAPFGSFSAIAMAPDGDSFITVSDKGHWAEARLVRDGGRLAGIESLRAGPLLDTAGRPVTRFDIDAEGIAVEAAGTILVSFEANHRVWRYAEIAGPAEALPDLPFRDELQNNSSLEALAVDTEGAIYTVPERSGKLDRPFPVYRLAGGHWAVKGGLARSGDFLVTGADFGPDGRLWIVERAQRWYGFASRVRRFGVTGDGYDGGETLLETGFPTVGDTEGIDVWRDADGVTRVTLITDDGGGLLQTSVLEYRLAE